MSRILDNFEATLNAQERALGSRLLATVGNVVNKDALVGEIPVDPEFSGGGKSETGTYTLQMRVSDFATPPETQVAVVAKGKALKLFSYTETGGVYTLIAGDPTTEV